MSATLLCTRCKHPSHEHDWTGDCHVMTEPSLRCFCTQFLREPLDEFYANASPSPPNEAQMTCSGCARTYKAVWDGERIFFQRISDAPAQGSESRPGVSTAVESNSADENSGAESADIGKLDRVDELGCSSISGGVKCTRDLGHAGDHRAGDSFRWAGSAETGGEKADV